MVNAISLIIQKRKFYVMVLLQLLIYGWTSNNLLGLRILQSPTETQNSFLLIQNLIHNLHFMSDECILFSIDLEIKNLCHGRLRMED